MFGLFRRKLRLHLGLKTLQMLCWLYIKGCIKHQLEMSFLCVCDKTNGRLTYLLRIAPAQYNI